MYINYSGIISVNMKAAKTACLSLHLVEFFLKREIYTPIMNKIRPYYKAAKHDVLTLIH